MPQNWAMGVNPNATQLLDWGALKDAMQTTQHNKAKYVPCSDLYDGNSTLQEFVAHVDASIFKAFGYQKRCSDSI